MFNYLKTAANLNILSVHKGNPTDNTNHCSFNSRNRRGITDKIRMADDRST